MSTRELIEAEMERLNDDQLDQLLRVVQELSEAKGRGSSPSLMAKLKQVKIDGPEDFALNHDLYMGHGGLRGVHGHAPNGHLRSVDL